MSRTIDHFVQVDLLGFYNISNAIQGVKVDMCAAVKEPDSRDPTCPRESRPFKGTQALAFVRQRYNFPNGLGDLDRVERQRYFLTAAFRKITTAGILLNPLKLDKLLKAVQQSLYMDSGLDPLKLAQQMSNLSADNIVGQTIPTDGFGTTSGGQSIVVVNPFEVQAFVTKLIGPTDPKLAAAKPVSPASVTVNVAQRQRDLWRGDEQRRGPHPRRLPHRNGGHRADADRRDRNRVRRRDAVPGQDRRAVRARCRAAEGLLGHSGHAAARQGRQDRQDPGGR